MKALGKLHQKPGLWLYDAPKPEMGPNDLLIKVKQTSLCGTDLHIYDWDEWAQRTVKTPLTTGHEFFGVVEDSGSNVQNFKKGDRVAGEGHIVCGQCRSCRAGTFHLCPNTKGLGVQRTGCFAEYVVLPAFNAFLVPDDISDDVATILDPFGNAVHTALSFDLVGEDVLITGAGPIGQMACAVAKKVGARHIVATDIHDARLDMALTMGATAVVNTNREKLSDFMQRINLNEGFTVGLEMSGAQKALDEMIDASATGAKIALLGILPSKTIVDGTKVIFKSLHLKGIYGREMFGTWQKAIRLLQEGVDLSPVITDILSYDDFERAFSLMRAAEGGKIILKWE